MGSSTVPDGVRQSPDVVHRGRVAQPAAPAEEPGAVGFVLDLPQALAFDDRMLRGPDLRLARRAAAPGRQQRSGLVEIFGLHEHLRERGMGQVGGGRRQHEFAVRGDVDIAHPVAGIGKRDATHFGVILGRDQHLQSRGDRAIDAHELGPVLGEGHFIRSASTPQG